MNLFDKDVAKYIVKSIQDENDRLKINEKLFNIYEGQIGPILIEKMKNDISESSFIQAKERICPINILEKVIDKLSKIYQQEPKREVMEGRESDKKIVENLEEILNIDHKLNINNEFSNLFRYSLLQLGVNLETRKPFVRTIPNHKFVVINTSQVDPTNPDIVCLLMNSVETAGIKTEIYHIYTDYQFAVYDGSGTIRYDIMAELGQDGTIPTNKKPFIYLNMSDNLIMPNIQTDTLDMSLLIPLLLSDGNYIAKFCAFSILYGIDIDDKNMKRAPNTFWSFKSDAESDKAPSIGSVKPEGDIQVLISSAMSQLGIWLDTKGLKAGSIDQLTSNNAVSGIAKMIDEADVTDSRQHQASIYRMFEVEFWDLLLNYWYPFWVEQGLVDNLGMFSPNAYVATNFKPQIPLYNRGQQVKDLKEEVTAGFTTRKRAIIALNPKMSDYEIDKLLEEIEEDKPVAWVVSNGADQEQNGDEDNGEDTDLS